MNKRVLLFINAIVAVNILSCIDSGDRPEEKELIVYPADEGSRAYSCEQDDDVQQTIIDDFEFNAALATWYANNEVCEYCQPLVEERDALMKELEELSGDTDADTETETETETAAEDSDNSTDTATEEAVTPEEAALLEQIEAANNQVNICREPCVAAASPNFFDSPVPADEIVPEPRCGSRFAIHQTATGLVDWGANLGNTFASTVDATKYDGISFWARRANYSTGVIRVEVSDQYTEPGTIDENGEPTALCTHDHDEDNPEEGCDRYGSFVTVSTDWKFFKLPFEDMRQAGWGAEVPPLDKQTLQSVTFLFLPGTWDVWLDDVAFYAEGK